jgi:two-component system sensor histidine kinase SenX3
MVGVLVGCRRAGARRAARAAAPARRRAAADRPPPTDPAAAHPTSAQVIDALPVAVAVVDGSGLVVLANRRGVELGVVRDGWLLVPELRELVRDVRRTRSGREVEVEVGTSRLKRMPEAVRVRLVPVGEQGHVALLVEDITEVRRVEAVRRDFVANVSHELKTPVGAMALLSEALLDASGDRWPCAASAAACRRRPRGWARLVQELIDLSRLQGADPLPEPTVVSVDQVVAEAVDRSRTTAGARGIRIVRGASGG